MLFHCELISLISRNQQYPYNFEFITELCKYSHDFGGIFIIQRPSRCLHIDQLGLAVADQLLLQTGSEPDRM